MELSLEGDALHGLLCNFELFIGGYDENPNRAVPALNFKGLIAAPAVLFYVYFDAQMLQALTGAGAMKPALCNRRDANSMMPSEMTDLPLCGSIVAIYIFLDMNLKTPVDATAGVSVNCIVHNFQSFHDHATRICQALRLGLIARLKADQIK